MGMGTKSTWEFRNDSGEVMVVVLEPHGQEIEVPPGSQVVMTERGGVQPPSGTPRFEASRDGHRITVWAQWPGGVVRVYLDGQEV